jgi:hypothetical protein
MDRGDAAAGVTSIKEVILFPTLTGGLLMTSCAV